MDKKEQLIQQLRAENHRLSLRGIDVIDGELAVSYLISGIKPSYISDDNLPDYPILDAAINDFDFLCTDYGIK